MEEQTKNKIQSLIDYSKFLLCDECNKDNQNCVYLKDNSAINVYELLNSLIKNFTDVELLLFTKYILKCNEYYDYYIDNIVTRSIDIRKIYGKYVSRLDISMFLVAFYYVFFYNYFLEKAKNDAERDNVKAFFEYDIISKCINRKKIDINILTEIYHGTIIHFDINPNELEFGFNDIYEKYIYVDTNMNWNLK